MGGSKLQQSVNVASLADGDSIAAYLVAAAGALITSTTLGGKVHVDVKGPSEYAEDTAHVSGDYGTAILGVRNDAGTPLAADGAYMPLSFDANGNLRVNATINAAGDYAEDSAHTTGDVGLFSLAVRRDARAAGSDADGDYSSINVNAVGELWTKDADVLALLNLATKAEDAVAGSGDMGIQALTVRRDAQAATAADGDYSSLQTWSDGALKTVHVANGAVANAQIAVGVAQVAVPATNLANRKYVMLQNPGIASIFLGATGVAVSGAATGIEIAPKSFIDLEAGPAINLFAISTLAAQKLTTLELA